MIDHIETKNICTLSLTNRNEDYVASLIDHLKNKESNRIASLSTKHKNLLAKPLTLLINQMSSSTHRRFSKISRTLLFAKHSLFSCF